MLGQIVWRERDTPLERVDIEGMPVLRGGISRGKFWRFRLGRLLRKFRRQGVRRLLVPTHFEGWDVVRKGGLSPVDEIPFLRSIGAELLILAMKKRGFEPNIATVSLRGSRVDRAMTEAAERLVPQVRDISISAPRGGEVLQQYLRGEWGIAVRPDGAGAVGVIRFDQSGDGRGEVVIALFSGGVELGGVTPNEENFPHFSETEPLPLLAALWESGKIGREKLEFYLT